LAMALADANLDMICEVCRGGDSCGECPIGADLCEHSAALRVRASLAAWQAEGGPENGKEKS
jgi:hypothetical protein